MTWLRSFFLAIIVAAAPIAPAAALGPGGDAPSGGGDGDSRRRLITQSENYLALQPLTASVQANYRLRGVLHIEVGLEIADSRQRRAAERVMPRLRDAHVSAMAVYAGTQYRFGDIPDVDRIAESLQAATNRVLGHGDAEILLGMVIIHAD